MESTMLHLSDGEFDEHCARAFEAFADAVEGLVPISTLALTAALCGTLHAVVEQSNFSAAPEQHRAVVGQIDKLREQVAAMLPMQ